MRIKPPGPQEKNNDADSMGAVFQTAADQNSSDGLHLSATRSYLRDTRVSPPQPPAHTNHPDVSQFPIGWHCPRNSTDVSRGWAFSSFT